MDPIANLGFLLAAFVAAYVLLRAILRWQRRRRAVMGPTLIREIEDEIPTIDEQGNHHVVIRTRTVDIVLGPIGPTEVERRRRLTLPGHGPVIQLTDTEFEVFRSHMKLKLDVKVLRRRGGLDN